MIERWLGSIETGFSLIRPFGVGLFNIIEWLGENNPEVTLILIGAFFLWRYNRNAARKYNLMKMRLLEERGKVAIKFGFASVVVVIILLFVVGSYSAWKNSTGPITANVATPREQIMKKPPPAVIYSLPERKAPK